MPTALAPLACSKAQARSPASAPLTTLVSSFQSMPASGA